MLLLLLLGFSSGLPFLLILSSLSYWLAELGYADRFVTLFTAVTLPYSLKFLWAPLIEQISIPRLSHKFGQKRLYGLISQFLLMFCIALMGIFSPDKTPTLTVIFALLICFFSATQDIIIDGFRIDVLNVEKSGAGASMESIGFHLGKLASGVGVLYLAHAFGWKNAYQIMALGVLPGIAALFIISPDRPENTKARKALSALQTIKRRYQLPFLRLFGRVSFMGICAFILFFKIPDALLNATQPIFLYNLGLDKIEFANITKFYGTGLMILGAVVAGLLVEMVGLFSAGILCICMMAVSCILFSIQAIIGYEEFVLMMTIGVESFSVGLSNSVFIAILSAFCFKPYNASHFTILYSIGSFCRFAISTSSGYFSSIMGWEKLYLATAFLTLPAIYFLKKLQEKNPEKIP
jgi:PAT family beta-lactamase induction signal transducer AmpG